MHPWQGAAWHHLTSPRFLISILTVYQKRNRFGVRVLSTCMSLCVSNSSFALCPSTATGHFSELPGTAIGTSLTSEGTGLWMCCTLCLGWGAVTGLRAVPAAALTPERTCWRILPLHRAIIMTQLQFKDAFWVSEHLLCVSYIQCICILKSFKILLGSIYSLKLI